MNELGIIKRWQHAAVLLCAFALTGCPSPSDSWETVASDLDEAVLSISGISATDVWAVGADRGHGPLVLHYDGGSWSRVATGTTGDLWWIATTAGGPTFVAGKSASVLRYDGTSFTRMQTPGLAAHTIFGLWAKSASDVWAVGSISGRNGFVWHYDGASWRDVPVPVSVPAANSVNDSAGFFKVWGDSAGNPWVVGAQGAVLHYNGTAFESVPSGTNQTLFTVHSGGDLVVAVGGSGTGVILERQGDSTFVDRTPAAAALIQGVAVGAAGQAWASGAGGIMYQRESEQWTRASSAPVPAVESLHATYLDPDGGVWAVGGNVLSAKLNAGAIIHRGKPSGSYKPTLPDGGSGDGGVPVVSCPDDQVDPAPTKSIARRWNEQILNAIRRDLPRPGVHARNLFHSSVAMWDAWAAYDATADGYVSTERLTPPADLAAAQKQAISYAVYRVLNHRYTSAVGGAVSAACFRAFMVKLGFNPDDQTESGNTPTALGNRIGRQVIEQFRSDGANEASNYADTTSWMPLNAPLVVDAPGTTCSDPSRYQPLNLATAETQNGIVLPSGLQGYIGSQWGNVKPLALSRVGDVPYFDLGPPPAIDQASMKGWVLDVLRRTASLDHQDGVTLDISPGSYGNNTLGTDDGKGRSINPITGKPYTPNVVPRGDFARVLAEFWADGPKSETPPGHWNTLANSVADTAVFVRKLEGAGTELDPLSWDVHSYLAINGAVHDAAIAAWDLKRRFQCSRPVTLVRYMAGLGQSSDASAPSYNPGGLPLEAGLVEVITAQSSAPGQRHAHLSRYVGSVAVRSWRGEPGDRKNEVGGVGWIRAIDWVPYQRRTFVTPAFPGYVSGHSTFSRAAAEVLTNITGSPLFPGGLGTYSTKANAYLVFERGPEVDVQLQWATYYDAADQAGQSRIFGGIHILPDDYGGRRIGRDVGLSAYARTKTYWNGTAR